MFKSVQVGISNFAKRSGKVGLEQEPWDDSVNLLTKYGVVAYLDKLQYDKGNGVSSNCSSLNGTSTFVYAYPFPFGLQFKFGCTHGTVGKPSKAIVKYSEIIQCNLETEITLKYPTEGTVKCEWAGDVCDKDGGNAPKPELKIVNGKLIVGSKVYGTLLITYDVCRYTFPINVSPRPKAIENSTTSFAFAIWEFGNNYIEINLTESSESGKCNNFGDDAHFTNGDDRPEYVDPEDYDILIDYCNNTEDV